MRSARSILLFACLIVAGSLPVHAQSIRLAWDPSPDTVAAYAVLQGTSSGVYTSEVLVPGTSTSADVPNLKSGSTYYFVVKAVNAAGLRSSATNQVSVTIPAATTTTSGMPSGAALRATPTLSSPTGTIVKVSTTSGLNAALLALKSDTTIVLAPGTYQLSTTLRINGAFSNVGLRGATRYASDVVIVGPGLTATSGALDGIKTSGGIRGLTVANLTLKNFPGTPLVIQDTHNALVHNVHVYSDGRFVRGGATVSGTHAYSGVIQYSRFYYQGARTDYRTGIDLQRVASWQVRYNLFRNATPTSTQRLGPAVHAWRASNRTTVDANTFVNCSREVVFGLSDTTPDQHSTGRARNNMIARTTAVVGGGPGISVLDSPSTVVAYNTLLLRGTAARAIEYRYADTDGTVVANNLTDGPIAALDGATGIEDTNLTSAAASWFANPAAGDLRLRSTATLPVDVASPVAAMSVDHGGQGRPYGAGRDVGADEATTFVYPAQ